MTNPLLQIQVIDNKYIPEKAHDEDAGYDLRACVTKENATRSRLYLQELVSSIHYQELRPPLYLDGAILFTGKETRPQILERIQELMLLNLLLLRPNSNVMVDTGVAVALQPYPRHLNDNRIAEGLPPLIRCLDVRPRSGLANRHRITISNSPGLVDSSYRGYVKVLLDNPEPRTHLFSDGSRIAQMTITTVEDYGKSLANYVVEELEETERGSRGQGSSGLN